MTLTAKDVAEIMRLLEQSSFDSLSLEIDGVKLNLRRSTAAPARPVAPVAEASPVPEVRPVQSQRPKAKPPSEPGLADVTSPLLGIFYRAPKPGEAPFVEVGSKVVPDTVVGIIEVMKLMNSVRAGVKGEVIEILAENEALVEYGEILLRVRPEA
ncbi:MAG TPA: acetyl-CoA carboxylase biotin carboxyl carrier protein [Candidatus Baltobacteraceae bacterium]|nr:acetyl-CoA carboxylase biotin carboxyl carrier protein [Candidatus Baltobacteraceae bacterium]